MFDLNSLVKGLANSGAVSGFAGGLAGTAVAGALTGKKGKKVAKSALKVGALAAVGGLAYTAYQRYQKDSGDAAAVGSVRENTLTGNSVSAQLPPPVPTTAKSWDNIGKDRFDSVVTENNASTGGMLLVRAMIAAAAADGHMDNDERERVFSEAGRLELTSSDKAALFDELSKPLTLEELVAQVSNPETSIEVYAASLVAIDETRPEAHDYLTRLAVALQLPAGLVRTLHNEVAATRQDQAA